MTCVCWLLGSRPTSLKTVNTLEDATIAAEITELQKDPASGHKMAFIGMCGLMTLVKEVRGSGPRNNVEYLTKRWKALCATMGLEDIIATGKVTPAHLGGIVTQLEGWQEWMKPRQKLREDLLDICMGHGVTLGGATPLTRTIVEQIKMVLQNYGLKSVLLMDTFASSNNRAILLPEIARQAVKLRRELTALREKHGELFPYMRVYPLEGVERIHHRVYPDLYYASISTALHHKELGVEGRYVMTEVQTTIPRETIDTYADKKLYVEMALSDQTRADLRELGIKLRDDEERGEEEEPPRRRRRRD